MDRQVGKGYLNGMVKECVVYGMGLGAVGWLELLDLGVRIGTSGDPQINSISL